MPSVAVKSFPVTNLAPLANTSTFPKPYDKVTPAESAPLTESVVVLSVYTYDL